MSGIIRIDSRVAGFSDQPIRLIGAAFADTGELVIQKTAVYSNLPVPSDLRDQTVVVTDSPDQVQNWQLSFNAKEHLEEVISFGISLAALGDRARPITDFLNNLTAPVFYLVGMLMKLAPIGAFGAMAFTIGAYGIESIGNLLLLIMTFYITAVLFVLIILGAVARYNGFSIIDLIRYIKDELWLVLGTSSSEAALPSLMDKMQKAGCEKSVVGLVIPTGYSFNLDGTNIYMTMAALFIAQACNVDLSIGEQVALLLVAMVSSKGAAGVTGAGFITLAATLSVVPAVPVAGMALILGIDRFMSECRALTNLIGNACATIVVARWDKALDKDVLDKALRKSKTN